MPSGRRRVGNQSDREHQTVVLVVVVVHIVVVVVLVVWSSFYGSQTTDSMRYKGPVGLPAKYFASVYEFRVPRRALVPSRYQTPDSRIAYYSPAHPLVLYFLPPSLSFSLSLLSSSLLFRRRLFTHFYRAGQPSINPREYTSAETQFANLTRGNRRGHGDEELETLRRSRALYRLASTLQVTDVRSASFFFVRAIFGAF